MTKLEGVEMDIVLDAGGYPEGSGRCVCSIH